MKKKLLNIVAVILTGILLFLSSCTPGSCFEETNAYVKASMYQTGTGKLLPPDSISLYDPGTNSKKIYDNKTGVKLALIPLNSSVENCVFIIRINGINDTLTFTYTSYPHLISKECGYTYYHAIDQPVFTKNIIDKITITKNTITVQSEENIRIYY